MGREKSSREIAEALFITEATVEYHITNIGNKLDMNGRGKVRHWIKGYFKTK